MCDFFKTAFVSPYNYRFQDYPLRIGGETLRRERSRRRAFQEKGGFLLLDPSDRSLPQQLLARLIESEINSALIFVAVARNAYRAAKFSDASAALSKAEAIYAQASELAHDSGAVNSQATADRLRELRSAIDHLMSGEAGA